MQLPDQMASVCRDSRNWSLAIRSGREGGILTSDRPTGRIPDKAQDGQLYGCDNTGNTPHMTCGSGCCNAKSEYCATVIDPGTGTRAPQCIPFPTKANQAGQQVPDPPVGESFCYKNVKAGDHFCIMTA
jgi:hypothetical protein